MKVGVVSGRDFRIQSLYNGFSPQCVCTFPTLMYSLRGCMGFSTIVHNDPQLCDVYICLQFFCTQLLEEEYSPEKDGEEEVDSDEGESEGVVTPAKTKVSLCCVTGPCFLCSLHSSVLVY